MRPRAYAEGTTVPVEKTRVEIERVLTKHGANQLGIVSDTERGAAMVLFSMAERQVRMRVPLPRLEEARRGRGASNRDRQIHRWEQASRERWRAVLLLVRAKLELIELGLSTIEREFLADIALPNGQTVGDLLHVQLEEAYATGSMPPLLPPPRAS